MNRLRVVILLILIVFIYSGCGKKKINRDHIPLIKENLYKLQVAVKDQNLAQIDSLLSVKIISKKQSSDSLLKFVYGDDDFNFEQFGSAEIVYTNNNARIDCFLMGGTNSQDRAIVFFMEYDHDMWLFTSFSEEAQTDSLQLD